jgi:uncharacterized repeat protein (TIGR01451 family)
MKLTTGIRNGGLRGKARSAFLAASLAIAPTGHTATVTLTKDGPLTAHEGSLIIYRLEVVNDGMTGVAGLEVHDALPAEVTFVQATPTPGGSYDPVSGIWTLPALGTLPADRIAGLEIQALVAQNLLPGPNDVVSATNTAAVVAPPAQLPLEAQLATSIVCAFCIDWEIVDVALTSTYTSYPDPFQLRFFLNVDVTNNGPVTSTANVSVTDFTITGGIGGSTLTPALPVPVTLDPGQRQTVTFATGWLDAPTSNYTLAWEFGVSDLALLDPVLPNTAAGAWTGTVSGGGGGGCFIATAAYGSYLHPHVESLRRFRDETLLQSRIGRRLVAWYYESSPPLAARIEHSAVLKTMTRAVLTPLVFAVAYPAGTLLVLCVPVCLLLAARRRSRRRHARDNAS